MQDIQKAEAAELNQPNITVQQLCAALEIFGRDTKIIDLQYSDRIRGAFRIDTVDDYLKLLQGSLGQNTDKPLLFDGVSICRFYNENRKLVAIGVAPCLDDDGVILALDEYPPRLSLSEQGEGLIPDFEAIRIQSSDEGISVTAEDMTFGTRTPHLDTLIHSDDLVSLGNFLAEHLLPKRRERDEILDTMRAALKNVPAYTPTSG